MREQTIKLYTFDELTPDIQDKVIEKLYDINVTFDWWDCTYDDAKNIGLEITEFDDHWCKGKFINNAILCAEKILKEHGKQCETYKTADSFLSERAKIQVQIDSLMSSYDKLKEPELDQLDKLDDCLCELDDEFLKSLLEDYRIMLRNEAEDLQSREAIIDSINANEYEFTENGDIWR